MYENHILSMFRQYFDKLSMIILNMTEGCQPEPGEGDS